MKPRYLATIALLARSAPTPPSIEVRVAYPWPER